MKRSSATAVEGIYVYLIGREPGIKSVLQRAGLPAALEHDRPLSIVSAGALAALVSPVPLDHYGEGQFEARLKDPHWAAEKVMRHQTVTSFFSEAGPVAPLRFGVIYSGAKNVEAMLRDRADSLTAALDHVEGCEEWALNIYVDRSVLAKKIKNISPKLVELQERAEASSRGQAYLLEKQAERLRTAEIKSYLRQTVDDIASSLRALTRDMKRITASEHELKDSPALAAKIVYLTPKTNVAGFKKEAKKTAATYGAFGFRLELTGPWPPYNFVE